MHEFLRYLRSRHIARQCGLPSAFHARRYAGRKRRLAGCPANYQRFGKGRATADLEMKIVVPARPNSARPEEMVWNSAVVGVGPCGSEPIRFGSPLAMSAISPSMVCSVHGVYP